MNLKKNETITSTKPTLYYHELFKKLVIITKLCTVDYFLDKISPFELQLLCQYIEYSDLLLTKNARVIAYWAAAGKTKKKGMKLDEFWPLETEKFHGSTKANEELARQFREMRKKKKELNK